MSHERHPYFLENARFHQAGIERVAEIVKTDVAQFCVFERGCPRAFDDPDRLDVGRAPKTHLGFGAGPHHCLGAQLARMELQEAFRGLLPRLPGLRMAVPTSELEFRAGQTIASMRELPVTWDDT